MDNKDMNRIKKAILKIVENENQRGLSVLQIYKMLFKAINELEGEWLDAEIKRLEESLRGYK